MGVSIQWTGLLDWNTGLDYWIEFFPFIDKFVCKEAYIFYNQQVPGCYGWL